MVFPQINTELAVLQEIKEALFDKMKVRLFIKREDLIHPYVSGNKWYKLKYNITAAADTGHSTLLSFGGAYSNHIYALAAAGVMFGFKTIGMIRGEEHLPLNPTLEFARSCGMQIYYINRNLYRRKNDEEIINTLKEQFGNFYLIPEGGTNSYAVKGCREIPASISMDYDYICTPCGTGGTVAGLITGSGRNKKVLGFPVLKGAEFLERDIKKLLSTAAQNENSNWGLIYDYHFGGYARFNLGLLDFIRYFETSFEVPLDQVYTGKMMFGIYDLIKKGYFTEGSIIVALHTGGIQGRLKSLSLNVDSQE